MRDRPYTGQTPGTGARISPETGNRKEHAPKASEQRKNAEAEDSSSIRATAHAGFGRLEKDSSRISDHTAVYRDMRGRGKYQGE